MSDAPQSPCVGICRLDAAGEMCLGCFRTLDEIARWSAAGEAERRAIVAAALVRSGGGVRHGTA